MLSVLFTFFKSEVDGCESLSKLVGGDGLVGPGVSGVDVVDLESTQMVKLLVQLHAQLVAGGGRRYLLVIVEPETDENC